MRVKESPKVMQTALPKGKMLKGSAGLVEGSKSNAKLPKKPPKKEKYKK